MKLEDIFLVALGFAFAVILLKPSSSRPSSDAPVIAVADTLSEWQILQLSIAYTESKFRPDAVGKDGDTGILQLREIYIEEVNRLYGTSYTIEDAFDIDMSIEMFEKMQAHYNKDKILEQALYYHNKSPLYTKTVKRNMELIKRAEIFRAKLIEGEKSRE